MEDSNVQWLDFINGLVLTPHIELKLELLSTSMIADLRRNLSSASRQSLIAFHLGLPTVEQSKKIRC
jgi:hypothetical protein